MKAIQEAIQELDGKINQYTTAREALLLICPRSVLVQKGEPAPGRPDMGTDRGAASTLQPKRKYAKRGMKPLDVRKVAKGGGGEKAEGGKRKAEKLVKAMMMANEVKSGPSALGMTFAAGEKPDTVGGALKACAKQLKKFTVSQLLDLLKADADWNKLLEAGNPTSPYSSVAYWASKGRLNKIGDGAAAIYTVVDLDF